MSEQILVTVIKGQGTENIKLEHDPEKTLLHTLRDSKISLPALCNGMGKCAKCMVRFLKYAPLPTPTERGIVEPDLLRKGYRLACMTRPARDCVIETAFGENAVKDIVTAYCGDSSGEEIRQTEKVMDNTRDIGSRGCIVAVDIGTTTIAIQLIDVETGGVLDTVTALNPQQSYGIDVIARIQAGNEGKGRELQKAVCDTLESGIEQFKCKPELVVIACNTVMGHLFMGYSVENLGKSPFLPVNIKTVQTMWKGYETWLMPGISAFVGGDILSGLYACGLCPGENKGTWLFLDLGTNAEMVMGKGKRVVCTTAAAGPAFEGKDTAPGSERIYAIARLLQEGIADKSGLLQEPYFEDGIRVDVQRKERKPGKVYISQKDVRDIQMAKAAVRTGIYFLMKELGVSDYEQIERVYIAGGIGFYLDTEAAAGIGLLPVELKSKVKAVGNTALAGAAMLGRRLAAEKEKRDGGSFLKEMEQYAGQAECFQLAQCPTFEERYIDYMSF